MPAEKPQHASFRRRHRLAGRDAFARVLAAGVRKPAGPLLVAVMPSGLAEHRLGLSVGRRVGGAVRRVAVKRRIREAFRLGRDLLPRATDGSAYDLVVIARAHPDTNTAQYGRWLAEAAERAHRAFARRAPAPPSQIAEPPPAADQADER